MKQYNLVLSLFAVVFAGCSTIQSARFWQHDAEDRLDRGKLVPGWLDAGEIPAHGQTLSWYLAHPVPMRPSMWTARLAVEDARLALTEIAAAAPLVSTTPWNAAELSVSASYSEANMGTTINENKWSTEKGDPSGALSLDLLVYDFGRNAAQARAQAERVIAAEEALVREGYTALTEVSSAYFGICETIALFEAARTNEAVYALHLEQIRERHEAGEAKDLDLLRARLDLAEAREVVVSASNAVVNARADFLHTLGCLNHPMLVGSVEALENDLKLEELVQVFAPSVWTKESAWELASTNAPAMKIAKARVKAASAEVDRAIADLYPTVSASMSLSWTDPLWYFRWGFSAAQSLFTGFRKTTAVDRAVVALRTASYGLDQAENDLRRDLELALTARDTAREALRSARVSLKAARENLALIDAQYRLGEVNRVEFSDAVRAVSEALGSRASAFYRAQKAEASLFTITGLAPRFAEVILKE